MKASTYQIVLIMSSYTKSTTNIIADMKGSRKVPWMEPALRTVIRGPTRASLKAKKIRVLSGLHKHSVSEAINSK